MLLVVQRILGAGAFAKLGSSVKVSKTWERKLTWWTNSKPSLVKTCLEGAVLIPALLQRISSTRPVSSQRFPRARTLATLPISTSHHSNSASSFPLALAAALHSSTTDAGDGSRGGGFGRHPITMLAPQEANRNAASRPIPLLPPVIKIHFPVKSTSGIPISEALQPRRDCVWHQMKDGCLQGEALFLLLKMPMLKRVLNWIFEKGKNLRT